MIFEHFAINVQDPKAIANWYVEHVGLTIALQKDEAPYMTFLADKTGRVLCELYNRPQDQMLDFGNQHFATFHLAMETANADADRDRILAAGASLISDDFLPDGSHMIMMRDPFGICLQLCQRAKRMNAIALD